MLFALPTQAIQAFLYACRGTRWVLFGPLLTAR